MVLALGVFVIERTATPPPAGREPFVHQRYWRLQSPFLAENGSPRIPASALSLFGPLPRTEVTRPQQPGSTEDPERLFRSGLFRVKLDS